MKEWLKNAGCFFWIAAILGLSAGGGWLTNRGLAHVHWMANWVNVVLSIVVGIVILIILGIISFLVAIMFDKDYDNVCPDFEGTV